MNIIWKPLLLAAALLLPGLAAHAEVSLATKTPDLKVTDASTLGTNVDGIGLSAGDTVPAFVTATHEGAEISLSELTEQGPLLVIFYRGGWCPYCNLQIRQMTQAWPEFESRGVLPVLISVDQTDGAALAQRTYEIPFPVLSDSSLAAHEAFEVVLDLDMVTTTAYKAYGIDLEEWSGRDDGKIAVSSAFLVDREGAVQWAHVDTDYKTRPSVKQLLAVIDAEASD